MTNKDRTVLRLLNPEKDVQRLVQLRIEIEANDQLGTDTSEANLRTQFEWLGHDPSQDRWVIENLSSGEFIGHGWVFAQSPLRAILRVEIHPQWRRQGFGSQLLQTMIDRGQEKGAVQIVSGSRGSNQPGHHFLQARGFTSVGHNRFLTARSETKPATPIWPEGFSVQSYRELGDLLILAEGSNRCYADMWGHRENMVPASVAHFRENMAKHPNYYNPDGILVVFAPDHQIAGICFNRLAGEEKVIDSPGIAPQYRYLGLQRPLVQASMHWLNQQAEGNYRLFTWGDFEEAVQIYYELGFTLTEDKHFIEYLLK